MPGIEILQAGTFSTIQDSGRLGLAHIGVPVSGCLDEPSAKLANRMVDNPASDAVIEVTWTGIAFNTYADCSMAVAGAEFNCYLNGEIVDTDQVIHLKAGDHFKMGRLLIGVRAYIAFAGGFDLAKLNGSLSTLVVAKLGGYKGRLLKPGDHIPLRAPAHVIGHAKPKWKKIKDQSIHVVRVLPGPEISAFKPAVIRQALGQPYQMTQACNRQGFRLQSVPIEPPKDFSFNSTGLVPGSLQVTPDGQSILAMKDAQTTGGYPRIWVVNQDQLHHLAQVRPSQKIYFFMN